MKYRVLYLGLKYLQHKYSMASCVLTEASVEKHLGQILFLDEDEMREKTWGNTKVTYTT